MTSNINGLRFRHESTSINLSWSGGRRETLKTCRMPPDKKLLSYLRPRHGCRDDDLMLDGRLIRNFYHLLLEIMTPGLLDTFVFSDVDHEKARVTEFSIIKSGL